LAQDDFLPVYTQAVHEYGNTLDMAEVGGFNAAQFSSIDLNNDGTLDLLVFERSNSKILTFINNGTAGQVDYVYAPQYADQFPQMTDWVLLRDFDCDGDKDIFTYHDGGIQGKGISIYSNDVVSFSLITELIVSDYYSTDLTLAVPNIDLPDIVDVDGDGDLDILVFGIGFYINRIEYHKNLSMETYGVCDSLIYELKNQCWGVFCRKYHRWQHAAR